MTQKPRGCAGCPLEHISTGFAPLVVKPGNILMVGEALGEDEAKTSIPFTGGAGTWLRNLCRTAGIDYDKVTLTNTISCRPPDNAYPTDDKARSYISLADGQRAVAHCAENHLWPNIRRAGKPRIYAIGAQAQLALTGRRGGIYMWRGSLLPLKTGGAPCVVPTIHPAALMRQATMTSVVARDLRRPFTLPPENYNLFPSLEDVRRFRAKRFAFDLEWGSDGTPTLCGLSDRFYGALVVPWAEPYLGELRRIFREAEELIGHNIIGADLAHIEKHGFTLRPDVRVSDTMMKQHLCQPDYPHDLGFVASVFTTANYWKGRGWDELSEVEEGRADVQVSRQQWRSWDQPDSLPRQYGGYGGCKSAREAFALYNARDVSREFEINTPLQRMLDQWELEGPYYHVSRPTAYICRWITEPGLRLDTSRLAEIRADLDTNIALLEERLPDGLRPYTEQVTANIPAPPGTLRPKTKTCKGSKKIPHDPWSVTFSSVDSTTCPECSKTVVSGKMATAKIIKGTRSQRVVPYKSPQMVQEYATAAGQRVVLDHKSGRPTTGKKAQQIWGKSLPEFAVLGQLKKHDTLRTNFAKESLCGNADLGLPQQERMWFNLLPHGTSEGRLASSGRRKGIDLNIQNQPASFRKVYIPEHPDWGFLDLDIVQGENWLTTWIAQDWPRWERLQDPLFDEHSDLAEQIFNTSLSKAAISADPALNALRQIGKKINHGRNYGMGVKKQLEELQSQGYDHYTYADVKEFISIWERRNARTATWQKETIEIAQRQGYLRNAFGRIRWFSTKYIATEALAFLPASTLADTVLRMMICHWPDKFLDSIRYNQTHVYSPLVHDWRMAIQVHDSIVLQGPWATHQEQAERTARIMTQPWAQLGGFHFKVDAKGGTRSWGEGEKIIL